VTCNLPVLRMARVVNVGRLKNPGELPPLYEPLLNRDETAGSLSG
jgi:hypothetical protein